nr:sugar transferase [Jeotgalibacillus proteolyticus]
MSQTGYPNDNLFYDISKRILDVAGALFGVLICLFFAVILSPFYIFGKNKGPMVFKQLRTGKNGDAFYIYKFRSMVINAEQELKNNKILYKKYIENNYKLEQHEDPRITKLGAFIRKTSIDEFPQFINVLKGDMSLVGPRPVVEEELREYGQFKHVFLAVKPGITGYWQASGRSDVGYPERTDIELYYIYNKSLKLDIKIIIKTVLSVIKVKGAY